MTTKWRLAAEWAAELNYFKTNVWWITYHIYNGLLNTTLEVHWCSIFVNQHNFWLRSWCVQLRFFGPLNSLDFQYSMRPYNPIFKMLRLRRKIVVKRDPWFGGKSVFSEKERIALCASVVTTVGLTSVSRLVLIPCALTQSRPTWREPPYTVLPCCPAHLIIITRDQSRISAGVRKSLI